MGEEVDTTKVAEKEDLQDGLEVPAVVSELDVVLTHTMADFDALASAVGLAKIWSAESLGGESKGENASAGWTRDVCVILPRGAHPIVAEFLALHKHLFPIRSLKSVVSDWSSGLLNLGRVALVDCQRRDRVGPAGQLLDGAKEVHVIDHHVDKESDVGAATEHVTVQQVGSVSTIVTEKLKAASDRGDLTLSDVEATLMALGVHADTGSLTYDSATERDGNSLAWLMQQGASQVAVNEYSKGGLSAPQRDAMLSAFGSLETVTHRGLIIARAVVALPGYVNGMARVAQNILELGNMDVLLLGGTYSTRKLPSDAASSSFATPTPPDHMIVVGRVRSRVDPSINLNELFGPYGGGGHGKAAAVTIRLLEKRQSESRADGTSGGQRSPLDEHNGTAVALNTMDQMVEELQIQHGKPQMTAGDVMTAPVLTCDQHDSIAKVAKILERREISGMPVVDAETGGLVGLVTIHELRRARSMKRSKPVRSVMVPRKRLSAVSIDLSIRDIEALLIADDVGRLPILADGPDGKERVVGILTRTDLLRQRAYYSSLHYHNKGFSNSLADRQAWLKLRNKLKQFDIN